MERRETIKAGYRAFNGYVFTESDARQRNRLNNEINRWIDAGRKVPEWLIDESNRQFKIIIDHMYF